jgi:hypothetical protein
MNRTKPYGAAVPKPFDFLIACEVSLSVSSLTRAGLAGQVTYNPVSRELSINADTAAV